MPKSQNNILGINNRTENWKTAITLGPLITSQKQNRLADLIINKVETNHMLFGSNEVVMQFFWKGFRDHWNQISSSFSKEAMINETAAVYNRLFSNLRNQVIEYNVKAPHNKQLKLNKTNYICLESDKRGKELLFNNVVNTEIDVVLEAPGFLLIGEAKDEQTFGATLKHTLVHQLIRQYVMTSIVLEMRGKRRDFKLIPFIIGNNAETTAQVTFMVHQKYLSDANIITWEELEVLIVQWTR
jgi:hypothetical protein